MTQKVNLTRLDTPLGGVNCAGGQCPAVFVGSDGDYYIQGYVTPIDNLNGASLDKNEMIVRVPSHILAGLLK